MKDKKLFSVGLILIAVFVFWTILILTVDVQPVGVNGTEALRRLIARFTI